MTDPSHDLLNALHLARSDLIFLMGYNDIPDVYRRRAAGTVDYITRVLGDYQSFAPLKKRWIEESEYSQDMLRVFDSLQQPPAA